jgi:hypothetical protein
MTKKLFVSVGWEDEEFKESTGYEKIWLLKRLEKVGRKTFNRNCSILTDREPTHNNFFAERMKKILNTKVKRAERGVTGWNAGNLQRRR